MKRVTGIGGIFFKSRNPEKTKAWYEQHLGLVPDGDAGVYFSWREESNPDEVGRTVWSLFPHDTKYFEPSVSPFMVNYRVADLHALLAALRAEGVEVEDKVEECEYGKFAWVMDPEGNRIELWEPPKGKQP